MSPKQIQMTENHLSNFLISEIRFGVQWTLTMEAKYSLMQYLHIGKDLEASELQREFTPDTQIVRCKYKYFIIFSLASFFNDIT
mgnify:FL=1